MAMAIKVKSVNDQFHCDSLNGDMSYKTCIARQRAENCSPCKFGETIISMFPDAGVDDGKKNKFNGKARPMAATVQCRFEGCEKDAKVKGFCLSHYAKDRATKKAMNKSGVSGIKNRLENQQDRQEPGKAAEPSDKEPKNTKMKAKKEARHRAQSTEHRAQSTEHRAQSTELLPLPEAYVLTIDFSQYPVLHQQLLKIACEEIRTPEWQLLYMLRFTLREMEEKAMEAAHV